MPMVTKLGNEVIYNDEFPLIKLQNPSITAFCEVTSQINFQEGKSNIKPIFEKDELDFLDNFK